MSKKIGYIGVGKLGMDCAEVIASKGYLVEGFDTVPRTPSNFKMQDTIANTVKDKDIIFIAVPTPHDKLYGGETPTAHLEPKDFDYTIVKNVLTEINKTVTKNQLVVLISTVLPGTTRREFTNLISNGRFIYNPYLIAMGSVAWDMVNPEMVIIGTEDGSVTGDAQELIDFYKTIMENNPRYEVGTWDEAESIKIFYNTFISAKIGLVNMVQDVAEQLGNIDVDVVTRALANSTQRIMGPKYMIAGGPDSGACVLPSFKVNVDGNPISIDSLYKDRDKAVYYVESANYDLSGIENKVINTVTCNDFDGELIVIETESGKKLKCTPDHIVPVLRNEELTLVRAADILDTDCIFVK